jgi:hypothetical protein
MSLNPLGTGLARSRRGATCVQAAIGAAAMCVSLSACGASQSHASQSVPSSSVGNYIVAANFPVSAADWAVGQQFGAFALSVEDKSIDSCMQSDGLPVPPPIMNEFTGDNLEFPDLQAIAKHGFSAPPIPSAPDPTRGMSPAEKQAFEAAERHCQADAQRPFASINAHGAALKNEWGDVLSRVDATPQVQAALRDFQACTAKAGDGNANVQGFLVDVDDKTVPLYLNGQTSRADAVEKQLGQVFARCLGPAQALRIKLRQQQRSVFFASHAEAINNFKAQADAVVSKLERQYDVAIPRAVAIQS